MLHWVKMTYASFVARIIHNKTPAASECNSTIIYTSFVAGYIQSISSPLDKSFWSFITPLTREFSLKGQTNILLSKKNYTHKIMHLVFKINLSRFFFNFGISGSTILYIAEMILNSL